MDQDKLIEQVTQNAVEKVFKTLQSAKEQEEKKHRDKRLRNTKLLLKHYRDLKAYIQKEDKKVKTKVPQIQVDKDQNIIDLIEFGEEMVNSIGQTSKRTIVMIQYLDRALDALEFVYKQENNERPFNILKKRYVHGVSIADLAEMYYMNERSVYKVLNTVIDRLSILLFGAYGIRVEEY